MKDWKEYKLGDVASTNTLSLNSDFNHEKILYLDTGSITCNRIETLQEIDLIKAPSRAKRLVKKDDIIYSTVRPNQLHYGYIENPQENLVVSTGFAVIESDKNKITPKYLYYFLIQNETTEYLHSIAEASTSAYPSLKPSDIESLDILLPPLPEQRAIASVLSSLDDKIDLLHRQNKTLEAMAETLFRQWFVEEADEEWEEKPLSSIADFLNGLACQKYPPKNKIEKLPVLKIRELRNGLSEDSDWITSDIDNEYIVEQGDVIFSWSASLMVKIWEGEKCVVNQHLFKVTSNNYPKWFYLYWCKYHLDEFIAISESHATTMGHIKRKDLDKALVLIPSTQELNEMTEIMNPIIDKKISNYSQIRTIEKLRDTLLPKLMSGEVRVESYKEVENV
ncbi:MAG: restriction endonuclease subunit S [Dissulfurispiraceae bacterium]|jgi:type I restriction enzyme S subunit|nr:restriction endonuclease subunit S [Dissulfurispiraceae bacterium]